MTDQHDPANNTSQENTMTAPAKRTPKIVETMPAGTQAAILRKVINSSRGLASMILPEIALAHEIPLSVLQALLNHHGYPNRDVMIRAANHLTAHAARSTTTPTGGTPDTPGIPDGPTMRRVALTDLHPDPNNLRDDATTDIEDLAASIQTNGLLQPIVARTDTNGRLVVVAGHRRRAALIRLQWTDVDVVIRPPMRDDEVLAAMLIENGQRRDLDPIEEARGLARLAAVHNLKSHQIALKVGRSQAWVSARLALLDLTPQQQDEIRSGSLGVTAATQLSRTQSGKTSKHPSEKSTYYHFGPNNELAARVKARCSNQGHKSKISGGIGCGPCWEAVMRMDERRSLTDINAHRNDCVTCGHELTKDHA